MLYLRIFYFAALRYSQNLLVFWFTVGYFAIGYLFLRDYFVADTLSFLALLGLPYLCTLANKSTEKITTIPTNLYTNLYTNATTNLPKNKEIKEEIKQHLISFRYAYFALLCLILSWFFPIKSLFYFTVIAAFLFALETIVGKISYLPFAILLLVSTFFAYLSNTFGIPIRLEISELAATMLYTIGFKIEAMGNLIVIDGKEFSVDAACMGLKTIFTSYLIGFFVLGYAEKKRQKLWTFGQFMGFSLLILGLSCISNLIRILLIVIFHILPQNPLHDAIGMLCLLVYVLVPLFLFLHFYPYAQNKNLSANSFANTKSNENFLGKYLIFCNILLFMLVFVRGTFLYKNDIALAKHKDYKLTINGFKKEILLSGMIKFENKEALIYYKPVTSFYGADHSPMVCWIGSGYVFKNFRKETISGVEIYTGTLQKGKEIIYTAWWFDNGKQQTIEQFTWRWLNIRGEPDFSLVNVNANNKVMLLQYLQKLLRKK